MALPARPGNPGAPAAPAAAAPARPAVAAVPNPAPAGAPQGAPRPGVPAAPARPAAPPVGQVLRKLKRGELLFKEGENSRAMYFLKSGMLRIFKKKGDSDIEIDTVRSGSVIGELAFLDGQPRSASGEALTDCELTEISGPTFQAVLQQMPDWLKILLKTVVGRLRTASTRIRQLESASTAFDYSDKSGSSKAHYVFMSPLDVLKIFTGILLVASRNGTQAADGIDIRVGLLQRYSNQIMGVPVAKITTIIDVLSQTGIMSFQGDGDNARVVLKDIAFLEELITYMNEENLVENSKRHDLSPRGFYMMALMVKHIARGKKDQITGTTTINLTEIKNIESAALGRDAFRLEELQELIKLQYCTNVLVKGDAFTTIKADTFMQAHKLQRVIQAIHAENEKKRKGGR